MSVLPGVHEVFPDWLPAGGLYGREKWVKDSLGVDVFLPRGTLVRAPVSGVIVDPSDIVKPFAPSVPSLILRGDAGLWFFLCHIIPCASTGAHLEAGQPLAIVDDPGLDCFPGPGPGPSDWQHVDLNIAGTGYFTWRGGDIHAAQWLERTGYRGQVVERTPGPPDAFGMEAIPLPEP
jgi:hypothetical protein